MATKLVRFEVWQTLIAFTWSPFRRDEEVADRMAEVKRFLVQTHLDALLEPRTVATIKDHQTVDNALRVRRSLSLYNGVCCY